jgi:hypothetical protein
MPLSKRSVFISTMAREKVRRRHDCQPQTFAEKRRAAVHRVAGGHYQVLHQCRGGQGCSGLVWINRIGIRRIKTVRRANTLQYIAPPGLESLIAL